MIEAIWLAKPKPNLPLELRGKAGVCARVTAGPKRPHLGLCPGPNISLQGKQGLGVAFQAPPGSQASSRGEAKDSALLSSRDADLVEPPERPQGSPASSSVWREDPGLLSRPCRKRRPSACDDQGVSCVSLSCRGSVGFLTWYDEDLREPLV